MNGLGVLLALHVFMADTLHVALEDAGKVRETLPTTFASLSPRR
jgi:hypothetical protein